MAPPAPTLDPPSTPRNSKSSKAVPVPELLPRDSAERAVVRPSIVELATADPRGRFAAGLALGLALGFLPAHVYASFAEEKLDDIGLALAREPAPQTEAEFQLLMQQFDLAEGRSRRVKARIMVIAGAIWPTGGHLTVNGRLGALLELGAGFHPDLTGRENIYLNASLLGLPRQEIEEKFQSIIDFSELHDFIDVPLRNYSSGMHVRLGFSVAAHTDPDILIMDEALANASQGCPPDCACCQLQKI